MAAPAVYAARLIKFPPRAGTLTTNVPSAEARHLTLRLTPRRGSHGIRAVAKDGIRDSFLTFRPKRQFLRLEVRIPKSEGTDNELEEAGLDMMPHKWGSIVFD
jgi:hypothetical protein